MCDKCEDLDEPELTEEEKLRLKKRAEEREKRRAYLEEQRRLYRKSKNIGDSLLFSLTSFGAHDL